MDKDKKTSSAEKSPSVDWKTPVRDDRVSKNQPVRPVPSKPAGKVKW